MADSQGSEFVIEEPFGPTLSVRVGDLTTSLDAFLAQCLASLRGGLVDDPRFSEVFDRARDRFIRAGVAALNSTSDAGDWIQRGVRLVAKPARRRECYRRACALADQMLGDGGLQDFFFMHKPPGLRLRFRSAEAVESTARIVDGELTAWRSAGLIDAVEAAVYEPEYALFGGSASMDFVHALFTVDSLLWLGYHGCEADAIEASPAWLVSMALLDKLLTGLRIEGPEDIGVWDLVRARERRRLGSDPSVSELHEQVADEIRAVWARRDMIIDLLHPAVRQLVERHAEAVRLGSEAWRTGYFTQDGAMLGPRAAAASYVIFHWNRAALSAFDQALVTESLCRRVSA